LFKSHPVKPVHLCQTIENRPPHSMPGKSRKLQSPLLVKPLQGFEQPDLAVGNQVVELHL
jgi:hypothetical protein